VRVEFHPDARPEFRAVPASERLAMQAAVKKLEDHGDRLGAPHTSQVKGARSLRELRPRSGRSPWRAFYRRVGDVLVVAAFGPEALVDQQGFDRPCGWPRNGSTLSTRSNGRASEKR
jgi:hypothetical protein